MENALKKTIAPLSAFAIMMVSNVGSALAAGAGLFEQNPGTVNASAQGTLGGNITTVLNYFLGLLGLIAVAFLIYAGVLMVTAGGNEETIQKARRIITYGVIGLIIVILSYTIVTFVSNALG